MPYKEDGSDVPDNVKKYPAKERRRWATVWNSSYKRCKARGGSDSACESVAFRNANGVLKRHSQEEHVDRMNTTECVCDEGLTDIEDFSEENLATNLSEEGDSEDAPEEEGDLKELAWTTKFINALPNAAFAVVEPCYREKKTARHLPHHGTSVKSPSENSSVDKPHLRNALARMNQISSVCGNSDSAIRSGAKRHLTRHAKAVLPSSKYNQVAQERKSFLHDDLPALIRALDEVMEQEKAAEKTDTGWRLRF